MEQSKILYFIPVRSNLNEQADENLVLRTYFPWLLIVGIVLNVPGLWLDIIEPDGALYATIAKHIVQHNDWINLFGDGHDWLDKPHFPFWMAAISYKILGIYSFAYKLPAFLFWLAGLRYTYLIARDLFSADVAKLSVLIYTVALHSMLALFDVRAEPYLTTCIIAATWHMLNVYSKGHWTHLIFSALFIACAIMTKGIFVLITIGSGWLFFWVLTGQWKQLANYKWWLILSLCLLFMLPELVSLYLQFDLHPEKIVFGKTHVSGLHFFFWDSQFGRFFNTGPIKGRGDLSFFLHTTLWAFLPWSVGLVTGIVYVVRFDKEKKPIRWVIYGSCLATFLIFSLSKFQLPHYIVIEFPIFSMITAHFFVNKTNSIALKYFEKAQTAVLLLVAVLVLGLIYVTRIENGFIAAIVTVLITLVTLYFPIKNVLLKLLLKAYGAVAILSVFLFFSFFPFLLEYQSGRQAAKIILATNSKIRIAAYKTFSYSLEFYAPGDVTLIQNQADLTQYLKSGPCYLFTIAEIADSLAKSGYVPITQVKLEHFHVTKLKWKFLDYKTRHTALEQRRLLYLPNTFAVSDKVN